MLLCGIMHHAAYGHDSALFYLAHVVKQSTQPKQPKTLSISPIKKLEEEKLEKERSSLSNEQQNSQPATTEVVTPHSAITMPSYLEIGCFTVIANMAIASAPEEYQAAKYFVHFCIGIINGGIAAHKYYSGDQW